MTEFAPFPKIARLSRDVIVTEKLDGTNAQIFVGEDGEVRAGSRTRWITPESDNFGFAAWVRDHACELRELGPGRHFGEWWGSGIQCGYGLPKGERRLSLFNVTRWADDAPEINGEGVPQPRRPACCSVVPRLYVGPFDTAVIEGLVEDLRAIGSKAAPGFMKPEGIIILHRASSTLFKKTLHRDEAPKGLALAA